MKAKPIKTKNKKKKFQLSSIIPYFKTLYSNEACIYCATNKPWYISIIVFFVAILLAMIPQTVTASKQTGSSFISNNTYGLKEIIEESISGTSFVSVDGDFSSISFNNHEAEFTPFESAPNKSEKFYYVGYHETLVNNEEATDRWYRDLDVYFVKESAYNLGDVLNEISSNMYDYNGKQAGVNYAGSHNSTRKASFILFSKNSFSFHIYVQGNSSTTPKIKFSGDLAYIQNGTFKSLMNEEREGVSSQDLIFTNFKKFCDASYEHNRVSLTWVQSGISLGVNGGLTLILGLILFLLTRGKQNPNRVIKFYQCMLISFWASFTPGILSLALGFLVSSMSIMLFVMLMGFRCMWMSMKSLRPQYE